MKNSQIVPIHMIENILIQEKMLAVTPGNYICYTDSLTANQLANKLLSKKTMSEARILQHQSDHNLLPKAVSSCGKQGLMGIDSPVTQLVCSAVYQFYPSSRY